MKAKTVKQAFVLLANEIKDHSVGLCHTLTMLLLRGAVTTKSYDATNTILARYIQHTGCAYLWPMTKDGLKKRKAFCRYMAKQRCPLSKKIFEHAAIKFGMRIRKGSR